MSEEIYVYAPPCCISCGFPIGGEIQDYVFYMRKKEYMKMNNVTDETIFEMSDSSLTYCTETISMGKILTEVGILNTCCRSQLISWISQMR